MSSLSQAMLLIKTEQEMRNRQLEIERQLRETQQVQRNLHGASGIRQRLHQITSRIKPQSLFVRQSDPVDCMTLDCVN